MNTESTAGYRAELNALARTYELAATVEMDPAARRLVSGRNAHMVASGGAMPAALLAAALHTKWTGGFAVAQSPLQFVEAGGKRPASVVVVFSARARHPDTTLAVGHALAAGMEVLLVSMRRADELDGPLRDPRVRVLTVPAATAKDGFLATGSVIAMAAAAAKLYDEPLPSRMSVPDGATLPDGTERSLIVLCGAVGRPAAEDVRVRFEELGLGAAEVADYRSFAHGRHVGLARRSGDVAVVAFVSPDVEPLAERTLRALPSTVPVHRVRSGASGAAASIELLTAAMRIPLAAAEEQHLAPHAPSVSPFGRELYHLPFRRMYPAPADTPITRKAAASMVAGDAFVETVTDSFTVWRSWALRQRIGAVVLDYDGTCVATDGRYDLPDADVQAALIDLLETGTPVAFASGRGDSLYRDLRRWVPARLWNGVVLGLHNGSWRQPLNAPLHEPSVSEDWVVQLEEALGPYVESGVLIVRSGAVQSSVQPTGVGVSVSAVRDVVDSVVEVSRLPVRVASSGHSVDVVAASAGKDVFVRDIEAMHGTVLTVGDQGAPGGNDFALLSSTRLSVSVDRCSPALDRCWPLGGPGHRGPQALADVLRMLEIRGDGLRLRLPTVKNSVR